MTDGLLGVRHVKLSDLLRWGKRIDDAVDGAKEHGSAPVHWTWTTRGWRLELRGELSARRVGEEER